MKKILLIYFTVFCYPLFAQLVPDIVINEFVASNDNIGIPGYTGYEDWIEIKNNTGSPVDISGFYITDNLGKPTKRQLPTNSQDLIIPANGYLVLILDSNPQAGTRHVDLGLSKEGEAIGLYMADGVTEVDTYTFGEQYTDISMGRNPDNPSEWMLFTNPTPGEANDKTKMYEGFLRPPTFSVEGGFYSDSVNLTLSTDIPGATIYYSLDGSDPDPSNLTGNQFRYKTGYNSGYFYENMLSYLYDTPILIEDRSNDENKLTKKSTSYHLNISEYTPNSSVKVRKGTVVKAVVHKANYLSEVGVNTYFVFDDLKAYTMPVVSVSLDEKLLFDYDVGFYTPGKKFDVNNPNFTGNSFEDFRYSGNYEYFREGNQIDSRRVDFKIHGRGSKSLARKSLRVYGLKDFDYSIYEDDPDRISRNIILRNSGGNWGHHLFKDAFSQKIMNGMNLGYQESSPVIVFLNGEYWGIHNIRDRMDKHYLSNIFKVPKDSVDLLGWDWGLDISEGDDSNYNQLDDFIISRSFSTQSNIDSLSKWVDFKNLIDYNIAEFFIGNYDWPHNNSKFWRKRVDQFDPSVKDFNDGRWRWLLFDLDATRSYKENTFNEKLGKGEKGLRVFEAALQNTGFRTDFVTRFLDLLNTNFSSSWTLPFYDAMFNLYDLEIEEHMERWNFPTIYSRFSTPQHQRIFLS